MIVVLGVMRVPVENLDALRAMMAPVVAATLAEDGCLAYAYAEDLLDPGLVRLSEAWRDQAAFDAHLAQPHLAAWIRDRETLGVHGRRLTFYDATETKTVP
jgi:quinol monooxygenase YgiN